MPNKKNKNQPKNAFYFYMVSLKPQLQRQGVVLENGMQSLSEIAGPRWKDLPEHEKEVYQEMARQAKSNRQYGPQRNDRRDCTGQFISQRVDIVSLNENKRRRQRDEVKSTWPPGKLVCDEKFYMIGFMSLFQAAAESQLPCEVGVAEFSINGGIIRTLHKFIKPGDIPLGFRYDCMSLSEKTHKIPVAGLAKEDDTYYTILIDLMAFINPSGQHTFPSVYCRASEAKQTEACLDWLAMNAGMPNRLKKVYEVEGLICDLYGHISKADGQTMSKGQATDLISSTVFDYEPGTRCGWHENEEVKYCALATVKRYCYCMADFVCPHYNVILTTRHMPERPEGTFGTVLTTNDNTSRRTNNTNNDDEASYNSSQRPQMGRGYSNSAEPYNTYNRSGPTYESLSTPEPSYENISPWQQEQRPAPEQTPVINVQTSIDSSLDGARALPLGRGRGRGRGVPSNQFVRQPNMPQKPFGRGMGTRPGSSGNAGAFAASSSSPPDQSYASKGRGVRIPNTKPKVYAGAATAPHASTAPPPPLAWQHPQQQQPQLQQQQQQYQQQQQQQSYYNYEQTNQSPWQPPNQHETYPASGSVYGMHNISDVMEMMAQMNMVKNQ